MVIPAIAGVHVLALVVAFAVWKDRRFVGSSPRIRVLVAGVWFLVPIGTAIGLALVEGPDSRWPVYAAILLVSVLVGTGGRPALLMEEAWSEVQRANDSLQRQHARAVALTLALTLAALLGYWTR